MLRQQETNYIMLAIVLALGVFLVAGLVVVPAIEEAEARDDRNKRKQGDLSSGGKRRGGGSDI